jgi:hypothetical protein
MYHQHILVAIWIAIVIALTVDNCSRGSISISPFPPPAFLGDSCKTINIDSMDSRIAMNREDSLPLANLRGFLISWSDNLSYDDELGMALQEKYIQFGMCRDWVALAGGDSVYPCFFRQRPLLSRHLHQCALVFPVPAARRIDTLVYVCTEEVLGKRLFVLKGNKYRK